MSRTRPASTSMILLWLNATCIHYRSYNFKDTVHLNYTICTYISWRRSFLKLAHPLDSWTNFSLIFFFISSNSRFVLLFRIVRRLRSKCLYVWKLTFYVMTYTFISCASLHSHSKWYFRWKDKETPLSCRNLLESATCMDVKSILYRKLVLFTLTMINRK